jgi:hypothetical protein
MALGQLAARCIGLPGAQLTVHAAVLQQLLPAAGMLMPQKHTLPLLLLPPPLFHNIEDTTVYSLMQVFRDVKS